MPITSSSGWAGYGIGTHPVAVADAGKGRNRMNEIWRPVPEYEDLYLISNKGRIKSLPRITRHYHGTAELRGRELKLCLTAHGYHYVWVSKMAKRRRIFIHRMVALVFIGPSGGLDVCHNDGCKTNNDPINLRYGTHKSNMADKARHGTLAKGETHGMHKLNEKEVLMIRAMAPFFGQRELARRLGLGRGMVQAVITGRSWSHLPLNPVKINLEYVS